MNLSDSTYDPDKANPVEDCPIFELLDESAKELAKKIETLAELKLNIVDELLKHYNSHDIKHAQRTIGHLCEILKTTDVFSDVEPSESFVLICAGLLHDVGMGPITPEEDTSVKEDELRKRRDEELLIGPDTIDLWREEHHNRSWKWIIESRGTILDELDSDTRRAIAELALAHREIPILHHDYFDDKPRYAFYGACLRLADEMDITPSRIVMRFENPRESFKIALRREGIEESNAQLTEWLKVFADKDWKLRISEGTRAFLLESKIWDDELTLRTLSALEELVDKIEETIESTKDVSWPANTANERLLPTCLEIDFKVKGAIKDTSLKLKADYDRVWEYLVKRLYEPQQREYVSIREAISNSMDACRLLPESIRDTAEIVVSDYNSYICIEDNGIGISKDVIENYLKVLGSSYYESSRYKGWLNKMGMKPPSVIGQFGIGTFSYLLVSNAFEISTKTEDGPSYKIRFSKKFGVTLPGRKKKRGTIVTIPCSTESRGQSWRTSKEFQTLLSRLFVKPRIPLYFRPYKGRKKLVGFYPQGITRSPSSKDSSYKYEEISVFDDGEIGLSIESDNRKIPTNKMTFADLLEFVTTVSGYYYDSVYYPGGMGPSLLYSGMKIEGLDPTACPYTRALKSITSIGPPINSKGRGVAWIDLKKGEVSVNLTKSTIEQIDTLTEYERRLETLSTKYLRILIESPYVDEMLKFRTRYQLARNLPYLSEGSRKSNRNLYDENDSNLIDQYLKSCNIFLKIFQSSDFLIDNLIKGWFCINPQENRYQPLLHELNEDKDKMYYLDFERYKQFDLKSSLKFVDRFSSNLVHLILPYPGNILENIMKYYLSRNNYHIVMDSMIPPFVTTSGDISSSMVRIFPSSHQTRTKNQWTSEFQHAILENYQKFIEHGGLGILGSDILSVILDIANQPRQLTMPRMTMMRGRSEKYLINLLARVYNLEDEVRDSLISIPLGYRSRNLLKYSRYIEDITTTLFDLLDIQ